MSRGYTLAHAVCAKYPDEFRNEGVRGVGIANCCLCLVTRFEGFSPSDAENCALCSKKISGRKSVLLFVYAHTSPKPDEGYSLNSKLWIGRGYSHALGP